MADVRVDDSSEPLNQLPLPDISPRGLLRSFGPGMLLMMTGIGTSHLVTAPAAGGRFEYALLWCIPVAYIFKYYGFEMAFRFTNATGRSMLDAYSTAPGKWPLWYVLITTFIQCALGQAGRLIAAAAVCYAFANIYLGIDLPLGVYGAILGVAAVLFILLGRYAVMETVTKFLAGLLFVSTVGVYFVQPAPLSAFTHFVQFEIPGGSWLVIAAFLGLLPTGIDVSLQASEWGKAKKAGMGRIREALEQRGLAPKFDPMSSTKEDLAVDMERLPSHAREYCRRWFRIGELDFGFGHVVSFIIACIFLLLAAVWMHPSAVSGTAVIGEIGSIFNGSVGPAMMIVFFCRGFRGNVFNGV
ncbi:MAG: Nramp family divalent metal transporter [Vicinamibacterales bacterium]